MHNMYAAAICEPFKQGPAGAADTTLSNSLLTGLARVTASPRGGSPRNLQRLIKLTEQVATPWNLIQAQFVSITSFLHMGLGQGGAHAHLMGFG